MNRKFSRKLRLRNVVLALRDQLPLLRLLRNLRRGAVLGLFHPRAHFRDTGAPKVPYRTKELAVRAAARMQERHGEYFSNYKCPFCDGYHLGRNRSGRA